MSVKKPNPKLQEAIKDLFASQDVLVMKAIKEIDKQGDETVITPMLEVYCTAEGEIKQQLHKLLSSLKISKAEGYLVAGLSDERFVTIKTDILSFLWNARFEPVEAIDTITKVAIEGDFRTALEAITLTENMEGPFPDEQLMEAITSLSEYIVANKEDEKLPLLQQMHTILSQYELQQ